jgi:hypothetical protein
MEVEIFRADAPEHSLTSENELIKTSEQIKLVEEGITKTFVCARALMGQYVFLQLVGVEGSLSLCEVEVFATDGKLKTPAKRSNLLASSLALARE